MNFTKLAAALVSDSNNQIERINENLIKTTLQSGDVIEIKATLKNLKPVAIMSVNDIGFHEWDLDDEENRDVFFGLGKAAWEINSKDFDNKREHNSKVINQLMGD